MSGKRGPGQAWWQSHLDAIVREGIDTTAYAKREGLAVSNLYYWVSGPSTPLLLRDQIHG